MLSAILVAIMVGATTGRVEYKGDTLNYFWKEKVIVITGNAEVKTAEVVTKADSIKYDANTSMVTASGNPVLKVGSQEITGERMLYDLETGEGIVRNGRTQIRKGWFNGRVMRKVEKDALNIDYGTFTTCDHEPPHYYFWGKELKVYVDDMVFARPLVLFVHDIPLFCAPFWWFPIKKGRQSGLLHPKIGTSSDKGRYVENASYYWVINDWSDATFSLNYFEKRGPRGLLEGRWLIPPAGAGSFNTSYIIEQDKARRWALDCAHSQDFGKRLSLKADGHFVSDAGYKVDYEEETLVQLNKVLDSYVSVSKSWDAVATSFLFREWRDLATDSLERKLPQMTYCLTQRRILGGNFSYSGSFSNLGVNEEYKQHAGNSARFSLPFKLLRYLSVSPSTSHSYSLARPEKPEKPYHSTYSVDLRTSVYGRSIFQPEFRHKITPGITYSLVDTTRQCAFSVANDFWVMVNEKKINLARLNASSGWNFQEEQVNPVSLLLQSAPFRRMELRSRATYNPRESEKFKLSNVTLIWGYSRKDFSISANYSWSPREGWLDDQSLRFSINAKLTENWRMGFSGMYDFLNHSLIDQKISLRRDLHCWQGVFSFNRYGEMWRYDFQIKLRAIPEIKVGKGLFGFLIPEQ
jgi:lipopolysaccharide assembly outer membrane protein LptD (OstA)